MDELEKRARELLAAELDAIRFPAMAAEVGDADGYNSCGAAMVRALAAALSAAPPYEALRQIAESETNDDAGELRQIAADALSAAPQLPDGWVLVPTECTADMMDGASEVFGGFERPHQIEEVWEAMLAAIPGVSHG